MITYNLPTNWIHYDPVAIANALTKAKAAVLALAFIPYQRSWVEQLHVAQLNSEVAATLRIEGADFTEKELAQALEGAPDQLYTRSQRQAAACIKAYRWIANLPGDRSVSAQLICDIHRLVITGADEDHCPPGKIRGQASNIVFGTPQHRGVEGGPECEKAFAHLGRAVQQKFPDHDPLIQGLALHYHLAAMHPFLDGNGRTARALEALMLQRTGLGGTRSIALSNYYYEEKNDYLMSLAEVASHHHDLTSFLVFGLIGIEKQCLRLFEELMIKVSKALYRDVMVDLFNRLRTHRRQVIVKRHIAILKLLLNNDLTLEELTERTAAIYQPLTSSYQALIRDIDYLLQLGAMGFDKLEGPGYRLFVRLEWPTEITETLFFERIKNMSKGKQSFLG
ncbi:MAG: Fic family protein [Candidatus Marinimicrobia bacterium]|nr:Fic family protein [Candidatus Neomarinimicrobiota bacterium]